MSVWLILSIALTLLIGGLVIWLATAMTKTVRAAQRDDASDWGILKARSEIYDFKGIILMTAVSHFNVLVLSSFETNFDPGFPAFFDMVATVADTMAKGVFLDLFESFDKSIAAYQMPKSWSLLDSALQFVCRTIYSISFGVLAFYYGTRCMKWVRSN